jgi:hypothetical protein
VENCGNLLIIGHKPWLLPMDFIYMGFSFIVPRNEYFQGNVNCGKLELQGFRNRPKPHLTFPRVSDSLVDEGP